MEEQEKKLSEAIQAMRGPTEKERLQQKQVFNLVKKHARTIQNVSRYDLSDDTEYISHARMIKALGCNYLGIERR